MAQEIDRSLVVGDRVVSFRLYGQPGGHRVVFQYGTPGTKLLGPRMTQVLDVQGIELLVLDRPGYGQSTRFPGRNVADVVADVMAIADQLDWARFGVWGGSGGGPHALACAALMPERVERCACVVSPAPYGADGLDWFAGMPPGNIEEFSRALEGEGSYRPLVERLAQEAVAAVEAGRLPLGDDYELTETDAQALAMRLNDPGYLERTIAAHTGGIDGWIDDSFALTGPWGFDLPAINVPVSIWSAADDSLCPRAHSRWLAAHIPAAELLHLPHGHILEEDDLSAIYRWLLNLRR